MLETLITSKTRLKMLLKFFINSNATAYLRGLAEEFGESTNAIRHELNKLSKAGYLTSSENGRTIEYKANTNHPLFHELRKLVHKHLGIDTIILNIIHQLGYLKEAHLIGDYAKGKDGGTIEILLVGSVDEVYLEKLVARAKKLIHRDIKTQIISELQFLLEKDRIGSSLLIWKAD